MPPLPWFARSHMRLLCKTRRRSRLARAAREARAKEKDTGLYRFFLIHVGPCRGLFLESPGNFSGPESCFVFAVFAFKVKVSKILKLSVDNEAKLTVLRARNCATIQKVWFRWAFFWVFKKIRRFVIVRSFKALWKFFMARKFGEGFFGG